MLIIIIYCIVMVCSVCSIEKFWVEVRVFNKVVRIQLPLISSLQLITITMESVPLSDGGASIQTPSNQPIPTKIQTLQRVSSSPEWPVNTKKPQQSNLTQKISSLQTSSDPFKNLYHAEWRAHIPPDNLPVSIPVKSPSPPPTNPHPTAIDSVNSTLP